MSKLKVTWQDGPWDSREQPVATLLLPGDVNVAHLGEDTLVFRSTGDIRILLVIPEQRLISAVAVEENGNG
jgi:hypothetical protein